jgi:hypothetical protein
VLRGRISGRAGTWVGHGASLQPLADGNDLVGVTVGLRSSPWATADLVAHESFHLAYQLKRFTNASALHRELPADVRIDSVTADQAAFELDGLARVLTHSDAASRRSGTGTYLRIRDARLAMMCEGAKAAERSMESVEGTAEYVRLSAAVAVEHPGEDDAQLASRMRDTVAALLRASAADVREHGLQRDLRPRVYYSGAALAALLDDRSSAWRARAEAGDPLDVLLRH